MAKVFIVTYLASLQDDVSVSAEVFPTEEEAKQYLNDEVECIKEDYEDWEPHKESDKEVVYGSWDYSEFVELKIIEKELKEKK